MGGGWYCDKHKVRFENQNYCELCKLEQEQKPMTREEAIKKVSAVVGYDQRLIIALEALGLLKFDEVRHDASRDVIKLCSYVGGNKDYNIRVEEWLEGLVLWVSGQIVWKSWIEVKPYDGPNAETIIANYFRSIDALKPSTRAMEVINSLLSCGYRIVRKDEIDTSKPLSSVPLKDLQIVHRFQDKYGMEYHIRDKYLGSQIDLKRNSS